MEQTKSRQELMKELADNIDMAPPEMQRELEIYLTGYLDALKQVVPKTSKQ